jgi:agmatinase
MPSPGNRPEGFGFIVAPYERTTTHFQGAALGPEAVMDDWRRLVMAGETPSPSSVITLPSAALRGPAAMTAAVERAAGELIAAGLLPVLIGGEHTCTIGAVAAHAGGRKEMGVVQLDAHADLRGSYRGSPYNHACVMRRLHEDRGLSLLPIGIRALSRQEAAYIRKESLAHIPGHRLGEWKQFLPLLLKSFPRRIYLTVDMDFFDPSVVPGVGTPEPGGGEWYGTLDLIDNLLAEKEVVGFDIVELCPPREKKVSIRAAARLAAHILKGIDFTSCSSHNTPSS